MEITIAGQTWVFLWAIALGAALGVCYDVFRILRVALPHSSAAVAVEDVLFATICTAATFFYQLGTDCGRIRMFVLIGELIGFVLYYCTVGVIVLRISSGVIHAIQRFLGWIWRILFAPMVRFAAKIGKIGRSGINFLRKHLKIEMKNANIPLKKPGILVYNLKNSLWGNGWKKFQKDKRYPEDEKS